MAESSSNLIEVWTKHPSYQYFVREMNRNICEALNQGKISRAAAVALLEAVKNDLTEKVNFL